MGASDDATFEKSRGRLTDLEADVQNDEEGDVDVVGDERLPVKDTSKEGLVT